MSVLARTLSAQSKKPGKWPISYGRVAPEWRWAWKGLQFVAPLWEGGGPPFDPLGAGLGTLHGTPTWEVGETGYGLTCDADNEVVSWTGLSELIPASADFTAVVVARCDGNLTDRQRTLRLPSSGNSTQVWIEFRGDVGGDPIEWGVQDAVDGFTGQQGTAYELNRTYVLGITVEVGVERRGYLNGSLDVFDGTSSNGLDSAVTQVHIGNSGQSTLAQNGPTFVCYVWNRVLSDREHALIARDPFGPFRMARRTWSVIQTAAGALSIPVAMHHYGQQRK